jgi:hypothetical protein
VPAWVGIVRGDRCSQQGGDAAVWCPCLERLHVRGRKQNSKACAPTSATVAIVMRPSIRRRSDVDTFEYQTMLLWDQSA